MTIKSVGLRSGAVAVLALVVLSCSGSTTNLSSWKDQTTPFEPYRKVIVASRQEPLAYRQLIERSVVEEFQSRGVQAVASMDILPPGSTRDSVQMCVVAEKAEGVMIITPLGHEDIVAYVPERTVVRRPIPFHSYLDYWDVAEITTEGGYDEKVGELVTRQISFWNCGDDKVVWQGESQTDQYDNADAAISSFAKELVQRLIDERVVSPSAQSRR